MSIGPIVRAMMHNKTRFLLIVLEVAITMAIVTNCVNMILEERKNLVRESGFDDDNIVWIRSRPFDPAFKEIPYMNESIDADLRTLSGIPGVKAAASTNFKPWQGGGSSNQLKAQGQKGDVFRTQSYYGTADLFDTLGIHVIEGRGFVPADFDYPDDQEPRVTIVSRALAKLAFGDEHVVGKVLTDSEGTTAYTIVGIVDRFYNPYGWPIHEYVAFYPSRVGSYARGSRFLVRVEPGAMKAILPLIDQRLTRANGGRVIEAETIAEVKDQYFAGARTLVKAMAAVILLLVFITALGIFGLTTLSVAERTRQIGTRRALGATRRDILVHFLAENWLVTTTGLVVGVAATYALNFLLVTKVSGVKMDWRLIAIGVLLLWVNGLIATIAPAVRGSKLSPAIATRSV